MRCLFKMMRDIAKGTQGPAFDDLAAVRTWLSQHPQSTRLVGIIGFCLGGGFALMLAPGHGYAASAVNYGAVSDWASRLPGTTRLRFALHGAGSVKNELVETQFQCHRDRQDR